MYLGLVANVRNRNRLSAFGGASHQALTDAEAPVLDNLGRKSGRVLESQLARHVVQQQNRKGVVGDDRPDLLGDPRQALVEVEARIEGVDRSQQGAHGAVGRLGR